MSEKVIFLIGNNDSTFGSSSLILFVVYTLYNNRNLNQAKQLTTPVKLPSFLPMTYMLISICDRELTMAFYVDIHLIAVVS